MPLVASRYGKARVRVMRLARAGARHVPRELELSVMLEGAFDAAWTRGDNRACPATDSLKNLVNVVAARGIDLGKEAFARAVAAAILDAYPQAARVAVEGLETRWARAVLDGVPHGHTFTPDANGRDLVRLDAGREGAALASGVRGFQVMKTTGSAWAGFVTDAYRTLPDAHDRVAATSLDAAWTWGRDPADFAAANAAALGAMLAVFGATHSRGLQDSMHRMGEAALAAVPEIAEIRLAMPNRHYVPVDLAPFGLENPGAVFLPTEEPHGLIEATLARGP